MNGKFKSISAYINILFLVLLMYFMFVEFCYACMFWPLPSQLYGSYKLMGFLGIFIIVLMVIDDFTIIKKTINCCVIFIFISMIIPLFLNNYSYISAHYDLCKHSYWLFFVFFYMFNIKNSMSKKNMKIIGYFYILLVVIALFMTYVLFVNEKMNYELLNLQFPVTDEIGCVFGIFKRHNPGAALSLFSVIVSFIMMLNASKVFKILNTLNILFNLPYIYLSTSRNVQLGIVSIIFIILIYSFIKWKDKRKKYTLVPLISVGFFGVGYTINKIFNNSRVGSIISFDMILDMFKSNQFDQLKCIINSFSSGRINLWVDAIVKGSQRWLFGVGSENYVMNDLIIGWPGITNPHNIFLASYVATGIFGLIPLVLLYGTIIVKSFRYGLKNDKNKMVYFAIVIAVLIINSLEMNGLYSSNNPTSTIQWFVFAFILNECCNYKEPVKAE